MIKTLVAIFDREADAFEGMTALKELDRDEYISLHSAALNAKDKSGNIDVKQRENDSWPIGVAVGLSAGSFIGVFFGLTGLALGAVLGGLAVLIVDITASRADIAFSESVLESLTPGKVVVLAEIGESWTTPVDTRLRRLGGILSRRPHREVLKDQGLREIAAFGANLTTFKGDLAQATAGNRAAIRDYVESMKRRTGEIYNQSKAALVQAKSGFEERAKSLQARAAAVSRPDQGTN
jgi:uncharacterized membrane protein